MITIRLPGKWESWAFGAFAGSLGWVLGIGFARNFWSEQTAAWVQAVGSVGAILVAVHLGVRQASDRQAAEHTTWIQAKIDRAYAVLIIARHAHSKGQCAGIGLDSDESGFVPSHFEALRTSLAEIPLHTLGDEELVGKTIELRSAMETLIWNFEAGEEELQNPDDQSEPGRRQNAINTEIDVIEQTRDAISDIVLRMIALRERG